MSIAQALKERALGRCELCSSDLDLAVYDIPPVNEPHQDRAVYLCSKCKDQIGDWSQVDPNHWHCLNESMWSQVPAVQVMAWRVLSLLSDQSWAQGLLEQLYLDDEAKKWAMSGLDNGPATKDSNGSVLKAGDSVTLIKDLDVKGAGFTAKRGTLVRRISLLDNPAHIEGRVNGVVIVLLTCYLKKVN